MQAFGEVLQQFAGGLVEVEIAEGRIGVQLNGMIAINDMAISVKVVCLTLYLIQFQRDILAGPVVTGAAVLLHPGTSNQDTIVIKGVFHPIDSNNTGVHGIIDRIKIIVVLPHKLPTADRLAADDVVGIAADLN